MKLDNLRKLIKEELKRALNETRQTIPLKNLNKDNLTSIASPIKMIGIDQLNINLPNPNDSLTTLDLNSEFFDLKLEEYKNDLVDKFGANILNASVILDPSEEWFNKIKIDDKDFLEAKKQYLQRKFN